MICISALHRSRGFRTRVGWPSDVSLDTQEILRHPRKHIEYIRYSSKSPIWHLLVAQMTHTDTVTISDHPRGFKQRLWDLSRMFENGRERCKLSSLRRLVRICALYMYSVYNTHSFSIFDFHTPVYLCFRDWQVAASYLYTPEVRTSFFAKGQYHTRRYTDEWMRERYPLDFIPLRTRI